MVVAPVVVAAAAAVAVAVAAVGVAPACGQTWLESFEADVTVLDSQGVSGGVTGTVFYDFASERRRIDYDIGLPGSYSQVTELIEYDNGLRRLYCASCETESINDPMEELWPSASAGWSLAVVPENFTSADGRVCAKYTRNAAYQGEGLLFEIYAHAATGTTCRATWDDALIAGTANAGETLLFDNVVALAQPSVLTTPSSWNCTNPSCRVQMDLVLVLDRSGSINTNEWALVVDFTQLVVNAYSIGPDLVRIGIVFFAGTGAEQVYMSIVDGDNQAYVDSQASNMPKGSGATCIPCGMTLARQDLVANGRPNVGWLMITMTDGVNNRRSGEIDDEAALAQAAGITLYSIGVGGGIRYADLEEAAGGVPSRVFISPSFARLAEIVQNITTETCTELPGNPCGTGCRGFCACGQTCLCPTTCQGVDRCVTGLCVQGQAGNGCQFRSIDCNDMNECTDDSCSNSTGCINTPFPPARCDDMNECTTDSCNPTVAGGCQSLPINAAVLCDDGNPCTLDVCLPGTGCDNSTAQPCSFCPFFDVEANCGRSDNCTTYSCGENATAAFCVSTPVNCDDGNACSTDTCDPALGCQFAPLVCDDNNACTIDGCNASSGCTVEPAPPCDDLSVCTTDTCDPLTGCVFTPNAPCDDNSSCTDDSCNSLTGCVFRVRDCSGVASDACHYGLCDAVDGCVDTLIPGARVVCGVCNGEGDPENCDPSIDTTGAVVGISAAAIILIIGGIALCLALSALGGKKGYDILTKAQDAQLPSGGSELYAAGNMAGENPFTD